MTSPMAVAGQGAKAAGTVLKVGSIFGQAAEQRVQLESQMDALNIQKAVENQNTRLQLRAMRRQARRMESNQKEAFIKGGVKLEGSALDVLADTALEFYEAEIQKQREQDYRNEQMAVQQANLSSEKRAVHRRAMMAATTTTLDAFASSASAFSG